MFETIKSKLWQLLSEKAISLALVYDNEGRILWHRGRNIVGKNVMDGDGFSKSSIKSAFNSKDTVQEKDVLITLSGLNLPQSARILFIKSLIILPVEGQLYLYLDSGIKDAFTGADVEVFKTLARLMGDVINDINRGAGHVAGLSGTSEATIKIRKQMVKYAVEEDPVLLLGETGVGKNHVAALIHRYSGLKGPFVVVHTPSIPEALLESELFGHRKGAFTGATENKKGLVEEAMGGTLFFDEISEIPVSFQSKLLQLIDTKKYRMIGASGEKEANVRIIAASNRNLEEECNNGNFRSDLFYRLNVLPILITPLRERKEDILSIVEEFKGFLRGKEYLPCFMDKILDYSWPGNVRQLLHFLKRVGVDLQGPITAEAITPFLTGNPRQQEMRHGQDLGKFIQAVTAGVSFWDSIWKAFIKRDISRSDLKDFLEPYFIKSDRNLKRMSQSLNIKEAEYSRFISALHKYKIHPRHS